LLVYTPEPNTLIPYFHLSLTDNALTKLIVSSHYLSKLFRDLAPPDLIKNVRGESLNILTPIGLGELLLFSSLFFLSA
jgi:hypothetical protein